MAMIFDQFPSDVHAEGFAELARGRYGLDVQVFDNWRDADAHDPFPFVLLAPIVHVARADEATEGQLVAMATACGGVFAGT